VTAAASEAQQQLQQPTAAAGGGLLPRPFAEPAVRNGCEQLMTVSKRAL
jgi:hypothetical protein